MKQLYINLKPTKLREFSILAIVFLLISIILYIRHGEIDILSNILIFLILLLIGLNIITNKWGIKDIKNE